jgi:hypothetical protein
VGQSCYCKKSKSIDELVAWMDRLVQPYDFEGLRYVKHIDAFQIVPLPSSYECVVVCSEMELELREG